MRRALRRRLSTLALLLAALPVNAALTAVALLRALVVDAAARGRRPTPKTILVSGGKMTKALQLARSFHARRAPGGAGRVGASTGSPGTGSRGRSTASTPCRTRTRRATPTRCSRSCAAEGVDVYVPVCSPAASLLRRAGEAAARRALRGLHVDPDDGRAGSTTSTRSRSPRRRSACPCPTRTASPTRSRCSTFDFAARGRTFVLKSIAYDPVRRLDLTPLPRPTPAETARVRARAADLAGQPVDPAGVRRRPGVLHAQHRPRRARAAALLLRVVGVPGQLRDGRQARDRGLGPALRRRRSGSPARCRSTSSRPRTATSYAIECNPRTHSAITMFHDHPDVARAYLEDGVDADPAAADEPADVLDLPRAVAAAHAAADAPAPAAHDPARQGRDLRLGRPAAVPDGPPRCRSRRCCSTTCAAGRAGCGSTSTSASSSSRRGTERARVLHLVGSAVSDVLRRPVAALRPRTACARTADPSRYDVHHRLRHARTGAGASRPTWSPTAIAAAAPLPLGRRVAAPRGARRRRDGPADVLPCPA